MSVRFQGLAIGSRGQPISNATIAVLTQPANTSTQPGSPLATLATSASTSSGGTNPFTADANGNFFFYAAPGTYTLQIYGPQLSTQFVEVDLPVTDPAGATFTSGRPWIDVTGPGYLADPTGVADSTTAIQNAHNAAVAFATGPAVVYFPYGTYKVTSLNWSPYVQAVSGGRVILTTALASGNFISISDQYGKPTPDPNSNGTTRSKNFTGQFVFINTNAANTAFGFFLGGATSANFATEVEIVNGLSATGFFGGMFKFGFNAFLIRITNFFGQLNKGPYFSIAAGATGSGEGISIAGSAFGSTAGGGANFLVSWNTSDGTDFDFTDCSVDYLDGANDPAQTAINTVVNMTNTHFEWSETANPYINLNNGIQFRLVNFSVTSPTLAGFANPFVGKVAGTSVLAALNGRYILGANAGNLYDQSSVTGLLVLDPVFTANVNPTTYFTQSGGANAKVLYNAVATNASLTVVSGTTTLTANAALAAVTSQAANTTAATGALTTDSIEWAFATAPTAGDNLCHVLAYVTAGNVNFVRTNPTAAAQNVSALVINWRVIR